MKRTIFSIFAFIAVIGAFATSALAQTPERVTLSTGSPALVWEKSVAAGGSKMYVVALKKGQRIKLSYIEDSKQGMVDFGKNSLEEGVDFDYDVEVTKDYLISVSNPGGKSTSFRIFLSLETGTSNGGGTVTKPAPKTETVQLSFVTPDESKATRTIQPGQTTNFVFMGEVGLTAHVKVTDPSVSLSVDFCQRMLALNDDETCKLNREGEWTVKVRNDTDSPKRYTIEIWNDANMPQEDGGDTDVHITFPKGADDTYIEGTIDGESQKMFLFNARKGQTLTFAVFDDTNKLKVDFNKNPRKLNEDVKYVLNANGEWAIYVDNPTKKAVKYRLYIQIK